MSWGTCYNGSNNIHFNFPPLMNDSRLFSNYQSFASIDNTIKNKSNIKTNTEYRYYLQKNADNIIKNNQLKACDECSNCPYTKNNLLNLEKTNSPYIFDSILSNDQPYGYENSDLKNIYLSRQQLNSQLYIPTFTINNNN